MLILKQQPVRRQVLVITGLVLAPLITAILWSASRTRGERQAEVREQAESVAVTAAAFLNHSFDALDSLAISLVRHHPVMALNREESSRVFARILGEQPLLLSILLTDTNGVPAGAAPELPVPAVASPDRSYVRQVALAGSRVVDGIAPDPISGTLTVVFGYPVSDDTGSVVGVIGLAVNLARLQSVLAGIPLPEGSVVTVTDRSGRVVVRSGDAEAFAGSTAGDPARAPGDPVATSRRSGIDDVERFYGDAGVAHGEWSLSVGIPRTVAAGRFIPLWRRNLSIAVSGVAAFLLLSLWFAHVTARNVDRLRSAAQRIADGDLSPPAVARAASLEFAQLQDAFVTMAANLRDARDALDRRMRQDRKMNETLQSLQRQVVRQERLAAVGLLVSGVAHELNNPLQAILGTSELLERRQGLHPEVLEEIVFVKTQSGRAREIIRNLSRFSAQQSGQATQVDLRHVIAEVVQIRRGNLQLSGIALEVQEETGRKVHASFTELEQVILNFVINAQQSIEASGSGGRILIRLFDVGKKVRLEVLDDGPGVTAQDEPKLFQPFFTTKPVGKGTGLGLSVSYGIIDSYGGAIGHRSNEWGGATFFFELPAGDAGDDTTDDRQALLHRSV